MSYSSEINSSDQFNATKGRDMLTRATTFKPVSAYNSWKALLGTCPVFVGSEV